MLVRDLSRRSFLHGLTGGSLAAFTTPGLFAHRSVVPRARSRASGWCRCHLRARGAHGRSCPPASPTAMTHIAIH